MSRGKLYLDACCLIEVVKGDLGYETPAGREDDLDMLQRILRAARDDKLVAFTSLFSVTEVIKAGDKPIDDALKQRIERLMMSGRDGVTLVGLTPWVVGKARDLAWENGMKRVKGGDRTHVASALYASATEYISWDNRLGKKITGAKLDGLRFIAPSDTALLPEEYRENDLFEKEPS